MLGMQTSGVVMEVRAGWADLDGELDVLNAGLQMAGDFLPNLLVARFGVARGLLLFLEWRIELITKVHGFLQVNESPIVIGGLQMRGYCNGLIEALVSLFQVTLFQIAISQVVKDSRGFRPRSKSGIIVGDGARSRHLQVLGAIAKTRPCSSARLDTFRFLEVRKG